jgi:hypothetical protein
MKRKLPLCTFRNLSKAMLTRPSCLLPSFLPSFSPDYLPTLIARISARLVPTSAVSTPKKALVTQLLLSLGVQAPIEVAVYGEPSPRRSGSSR